MVVLDICFSFTSTKACTVTKFKHACSLVSPSRHWHIHISKFIFTQLHVQQTQTIAGKRSPNNQSQYISVWRYLNISVRL